MGRPATTFVAIARIAKPHGIRGEFSVTPFIDAELVEDRFSSLKEFYLKNSGGSGPSGIAAAAAASAGASGSTSDDAREQEGYRKCTVSSVKFTPRYVIIGSPEVTLADAQRLYNSFVFIRRSELAKLPDGVFYAYELIGASVFDEQGKLRGEVCDAINSTGNDLIEVKLAEGGQTVLVPFVGEFIKKVDVEAAEVVVNFMEGLI